MKTLEDLRECLQDDIICCVESDNEIVQRFPQLLDLLCQIVVDRVNAYQKENQCHK